MDGDGDLDLVLADWGVGNNMTNQGGRTRLWLNDGTGRFADETAACLPEALIRFSWELEDILISCKRGPSIVRAGLVVRCIWLLRSPKPDGCF